MPTCGQQPARQGPHPGQGAPQRGLEREGVKGERGLPLPGAVLGEPPAPPRLPREWTAGRAARILPAGPLTFLLLMSERPG